MFSFKYSKAITRDKLNREDSQKRLPHKAASLSRERLGATTSRPARLPPARSSRDADALAEQAADAADVPWLRELQAPAEHAEEREKWDFVLAEADEADRRRQAWAVPLRFVLGVRLTAPPEQGSAPHSPQLSYLLALGLLLAFLPDLGHVLEASPAQLQLFALQGVERCGEGGAVSGGRVGCWLSCTACAAHWAAHSGLDCPHRSNTRLL
jgi:hypothetical protein